MIPPPIPPNEQERLEGLRSLGLLDTPPEERFDRITALARRMFGVPISLLSLVDANRQWFKSKQGIDATETSREISFCGHAILQDDLFLVSDALIDERFRDNPLVTEDPKIRMYAGYPLRLPDGLTVGMFCLIDRVPRRLTEIEQVNLRDLGAWVEHELNAVRLENMVLDLHRGEAQTREYTERLVRVNRILRRMASVDGLTGIPNRMYFDDQLAREFSRSRRNTYHLSLIMVDIDHFKDFNDVHGHLQGDDCLKNVARALEDCLRRPGDFAARFGGEEFMVVLPETDRPGAEAVVADIFARIRQVPVPRTDDSQPANITVSMGVSHLSPGEDADLTDFVEHSDKALYHSKQTGRNRATYWPMGENPPV